MNVKEGYQLRQYLDEVIKTDELLLKQIGVYCCHIKVSGDWLCCQCLSGSVMFSRV